MSKIFKPRRGTTYTMRNTNKKSTVLAKGEMFLEVPNTGVGTGGASNTTHSVWGSASVTKSGTYTIPED